MARLDNSETDLLFSSLAEQIKLPLVQIKHAAELLKTGANSNSLQVIELTSQATLRLIDSYLLGVRLQQEQQLALGPVSVSSLLYDTAHILQEYAHAHYCEVELAISGRYEPVIADREALQAALLSLGYSFIGASTELSAAKRQIIKLGVRRQAQGISTGVFSDNDTLHASLLARARQLKGRAHQPIAGFTSESGAGIFIADRLFSQLDTTMRVAKLQGSHGLAATFSPSRQLSLV